MKLFGSYISFHGSRCAISAYFFSVSHQSDDKVYVYDLDNGNWLLRQARLSGPILSKYYASSLAMSSNGKTIA